MLVSTKANYTFRFITVIIIVGVITGVLATGLSLLLHLVQHLAFQYSLDSLISSQSFLDGVQATSPRRRLLILIIGGLISGIGFFLLYRYGKRLVTIEQTISNPKEKMPLLSTMISACLQMITVGLGSPLGREAAPREAGAVTCDYIANKAKLKQSDIQLLIACAAGAGLAAVYNVPIAGALFALEAILLAFSWRSLLIALTVSFIATVISWLCLGYEIQYSVNDFHLNASLIVYCCIIGPILGVLAFYFTRLTQYARNSSPKSKWIILFSLLNFTFVGLLAMYFPQILGNGKGAIQLGLNNQLTLDIIFILLGLKFIVVMTSLGCGAKGGLLTPALMIGALITLILGYLWQYLFTPIPMYELTLIGAAAFLASTMRMPITATILVLELTHLNFVGIIPVAIAVIGSSFFSGRFYKQKRRYLRLYHKK